MRKPNKALVPKDEYLHTIRRYNDKGEEQPNLTPNIFGLLSNMNMSFIIIMYNA